jgi:thioester reductase-like protein
MKVCILYHCNEWKDYSSRKLIGVVKEDELDQALAKIQKECDYSEDDMNMYIDYDTVELGDLDI